ncbi:murein DD-endopeptidase MepM/ murein hydrolase activator NlpD [Rhodobacteraceae bacterium MBR-64]|jgi:murein DD-endopeptidase MepM/ murein hydrolase activator NlpD
MTGRPSSGRRAWGLHRVNSFLERHLPERRVFIRSDTDTRFIRLQPLTQAIGLGGTAIVIGWTILASAIVMMDSINSGNLREQAQRDQALYEARLNQMSLERDARAAEVATAYDRYNFSLQQISAMQSALLASEDRRKELETGIDVIQTTLRRTMAERDAARRDLGALSTTLANERNSDSTTSGQAEDMASTLEILAETLESTSAERDTMAQTAAIATADADRIALDKRLLEERNDLIFAKLEDAVTVSLEPFDKMFSKVGLSSDKILNEVRRGYSGTGGPLTPLSVSTRGTSDSAGDISGDEARANGILAKLDEINLYRIATGKIPFARPTHASVRFTSGFGARTDPFTGRRRSHDGLDFAGPRGTPILATGDGVVVKADWSSGYGNEVTIRHAHGIETLYAHMSKIRVTKGQRVSRGDRIGDMGSTGRSTGTHLHYEVHVGNTPVNPMTYVRAGQDVFEK